MKIGLLRHFKVKHNFPKWCNSEIYNNEHSLYDESDLLPLNTTIPTKSYLICYTSTKKRAMETAKTLFKIKEIIPTQELDEVPLKALFDTKFKFPFFIWNVLSRLCWLLNLKNIPESKKQTKERSKLFLSKVLTTNRENILIVSHGFLMFTLQKELRKLGFKGKIFYFPQHGKLYEYQNRAKK